LKADAVETLEYSPEHPRFQARALRSSQRL
jgi:hypothetical protein